MDRLPIEQTSFDRNKLERALLRSAGSFELRDATAPTFALSFWDEQPAVALFISLAIAGVLGCSSTPEPAESSSSAPVTVIPEDAVGEAERMLLDRAAPPATAPGELGGFVQISDDQLQNMHTVSAFFFKQRTPRTCGDITPLPGGGECFAFKVCDPPEPPFSMPTVTDVGVVQVSSSFDTIRLEHPPTATFYPTVARPGPFWRGDGDDVTFSFTGVPAVLPAFEHRVRAPVGDVIASIRSPFARDVPLRFTWDYADGASPAVGELSFRLLQMTGVGGLLVCRAPLAARAVEIPTTMLTRFSTGPATLSMASNAVGTSFGPLENGNMRISFILSSVVDTGLPSDPTQPNVAFR
jgi:hypothetical protein